MALQVIVIGAGLIGASLAWRLAQSGARVVLIDAQQPGEGTSGTSFAWLNANRKEPREYFDLNVASMLAHRRLLADEPSARWGEFSGHLQWAATDPDASVLGARLVRLRDWGYAVQELSPGRAQLLEPDLNLHDAHGPIVFFPDEGFVYPRVLLGYLLRRAISLGVTCHFGQAVTALAATTTGIHQVRLADGLVLRSDVVAITAGRWTDRVASLAGARVPLVPAAAGAASVGFLAYTAPLVASISRVISAPNLNMRPDGGGRLVLQALDLDSQAQPDAAPLPTSSVGRQFVDRLAGRVRGASSARIDDLRVGIRPIPHDGLPVVGWLAEQAGIYAVATHSGVTLGPILGELAAAEIVSRQKVAELSPFRPRRSTLHDKCPPGSSDPLR